MPIHYWPDARPELFPSLYARAEAFHRRTWALECDCLERRDVSYPCLNCAREIAALLDLLDGVARDAIIVTAQAWERFGRDPVPPRAATERTRP